MRILLLIILAIASVWDGFTTVYGTIQVLGNTPIQIAAALLFSALILGFVLNTRRVMQWRHGFVSGIAKFFWFVALCYDLYTSWIGNSDLIVGGDRDAAKTVILIGLTLMVTASPILLSGLWEVRSLDREEKTTAPHDPETRSV